MTHRTTALRHSLATRALAEETWESLEVKRDRKSQRMIGENEYLNLTGIFDESTMNGMISHCLSKKKLTWIILILGTLPIYCQTRPKLVDFKTSKCLEASSTKNLELAEKTWINDSTLCSKVNLQTNCCYSDFSGISVQTDTLALLYGPQFTTDSNGEITEIEHCLCDCFYQFEYTLTNIRSKYILVLRNAAWDSSRPLGQIEIE